MVENWPHTTAHLCVSNQSEWKVREPSILIQTTFE
uniref:Uncharacterized protein n=1 Tax=Rhizophora mucronata TaxID=61149 RepID=A0A2P2LLP3_RHIMU